MYVMKAYFIFSIILCDLKARGVVVIFIVCIVVAVYSKSEEVLYDLIEGKARILFRGVFSDILTYLL